MVTPNPPTPSPSNAQCSDLPRELFHGDPRATEVEALARVAPHLKSTKHDILEALQIRGELGLTPEEYQAVTGRVLNTVRRRFTDLWKEGKIRHSAKARKNELGNRSTVWVMGRDPQLEQSRAQAMAKVRAERDALREENLTLRAELERLRCGASQLELGI